MTRTRRDLPNEPSEHRGNTDHTCRAYPYMQKNGIAKWFDLSFLNPIMYTMIIRKNRKTERGGIQNGKTNVPYSRWKRKNI